MCQDQGRILYVEGMGEGQEFQFSKKLSFKKLEIDKLGEEFLSLVSQTFYFDKRNRVFLEQIGRQEVGVLGDFEIFDIDRRF